MDVKEYFPGGACRSNTNGPYKLPTVTSFPRTRLSYAHIFSCPQFRHSKKGRVLRSKTIALYLEPRFLTAHEIVKAGFHLAPMLRYGLDGMTTFGSILAIQVKKMCESVSRGRGNPGFPRVRLLKVWIP